MKNSDDRWYWGLGSLIREITRFFGGGLGISHPHPRSQIEALQKHSAQVEALQKHSAQIEALQEHSAQESTAASELTIPVKSVIWVFILATSHFSILNVENTNFCKSSTKSNATSPNATTL